MHYFILDLVTGLKNSSIKNSINTVTYYVKEVSPLTLSQPSQGSQRPRQGSLRKGGGKYKNTGIKYKESRNNIYVKGKEEYVRHQGEFIRVKEYEKKVKK